MESLELLCKNFKRAPSSGEVMAAVFCDMRVVIFVDVMEEGTMIISEAFAQRLQKNINLLKPTAYVHQQV
jgi:hypothetical protein